MHAIHFRPASLAHHLIVPGLALRRLQHRPDGRDRVFLGRLRHV